MLSFTWASLHLSASWFSVFSNPMPFMVLVSSVYVQTLNGLRIVKSTAARPQVMLITHPPCNGLGVQSGSQLKIWSAGVWGYPWAFWHSSVSCGLVGVCSKGTGSDTSFCGYG